MVLKTRKGEIHIDNIAIMILIIATLGLHNYTILLVISQLLCSGIILISKIKKRELKRNEILYFVWFLLFIMWGASSILWATHSTTNVLITVRSLLQEMMTGTILVMYADSHEKIDNIYKYILYASLVLVFRTIFEVPRSAWGTERVGFYIGYGANGASLVLSYSSLFAFHLFQEKNSKIDLFIAILFTIVSLLCGSKKALLITILGVASLLILKSSNILQALKRTLIALFIVYILYYLVMNVDSLYNVLGSRVERMFLALNNQKGGDMSTKDRLLFASSAFKVFLAHPITGVGLDNYRFHNYILYYAHNNYAEIAADLGIVGLISYYAMPISLFIKSIIAFNKKNKDLIFVLVFLFILLLMDIASVSFESDSIELFIAVIYVLYCNSITRKKITE